MVLTLETLIPKAPTCHQLGVATFSYAKTKKENTMIALQRQIYEQTKEKMDQLIRRAKTRTVKPGASLKIRSLEKEPKYNMQEFIARGSFAQVYIAYAKGGMRLPYKYCVKVYKLKDVEAEAEEEDSEYDSDGDTIQKAPHSLKEEDCQKEYELLRRAQDIRGLHVVHVFDCFQYQGFVWTVMEYIPFTLQQMIDFKAKIKKPAERLPLWEVAVYVQQILLGLKHLRSKRIVHRDIKPSNILLSRSGKVKLCDFGISRIIPEGESYLTLSSSEGTRQYMASELFCKGAKYGYSVDLWAVGIVMFNLYHRGSSPYGRRSRYFHPEGFELMQRSLADYIEFFFGASLLTDAQYNAIYPELTGRLFQVPSGYEEFSSIFQMTVVPKPYNGCEEYRVTRKVEERRITLEEFLAWTETTLAKMGVSELRFGQVVTKHVGECVELNEQYERYKSEFSDDPLEPSDTD